MTYKLGSLFDGSGGFPLAGALCGVEPCWASEVEPYPIAVTRSRFPNMKHVGDISKINGAEVEPVDILSFGSPCQDLSVAGKRAGIKHEANGDEETTRSGLFMEAVRIIKEMKEATNGQYPTFALWENVPGAFSSNKGEDFRVVLEELIKIVEPRAVMPAVPKRGWAYADSYIGDGWSLAYRTFDAQYWGVPQRRRRIHLVLDLRGERAREVLFEREGVRGYFTQGRTPWQGIASDTKDGTRANDSERETGDSRGLDVIAYSFDSLSSNSMKSKNPHSGCRRVDVAKTLDTSDPNPSKNQGGIAVVEPVAYTMKERAGKPGGGKGPLVQTDQSATLQTSNDQYLFQPMPPTGIIDNIGGQAEYGYTSNVNDTLRAGTQGAIFYAVKDHPADSKANPDICYEWHSQDVRVKEIKEGPAPTLSAGMGMGGPNTTTPMLIQTPIAIENHPADSRVNLDESGKVQTLTSRMGTGGGNVPLVMEPRQNVIDVETEVAVRKYEVDKEKLVSVLREHKGNRTNKEIAEALDKPLTLVEHWFRNDKSFAVPDPDVWFKLKELLGIMTTEFDQSVTEFEFKSGNYDMRNRIYVGDTAPTLTCGCGDHLHLIPEKAIVYDGANITSPVNASNPQPGDPCHTLSTDSRNYVCEPIHSTQTDPVYCLQGNGIDRADTAGCNGRGWKEDTCYTLNTVDRPAVAYGLDRASFNQGQNAQFDFSVTEESQPTLTARGLGAVAQPTYTASKASFFTRGHCETADCLVATDYKDPPIINSTVGTSYIVRRLTPTECARLQGFADRWGDIEEKTMLTPEEYEFWLEVRNTHAAINGKQVKDYTEKQMLTWYNKLHTDSAEYKMWGNGIALPTALYCLQGMTEVLEKDDVSWLL